MAHNPYHLQALPQQPQFNPYSAYRPPMWYEMLTGGIKFGERETQRKLFRKGIKRESQNFAQFKSTMLPIQEAELGEDFYSRGMGGGTLHARSLKKLREPYRQRSQALANRYNLVRASTKKQKYFDILRLLT